MRSSIICIITVIIGGCAGKKGYDRTIRQAEGFYEEGIFYNDSVYHGVVHRYRLNGEYLGYANYWHGVLDGVYINKYKNGVTMDSIIFSLGYKEGFSFNFDSLGRLVFRQHYLHDRPVGELSSYNPSGSVVEYDFKNFEGEAIYNIRYNRLDTVEYGRLPSFKYDTVEVNNKEKKIHVFLYLVYIPDLQMHYEIATVSEGRIQTSKKIISNSCFYETDLEMLKDSSKYAIVMSIFNKSKGRNDLTVNVLD